MRLFVWPKRAQEVPGHGRIPELIRPAVGRDERAASSDDIGPDSFGMALPGFNLLEHDASRATKNLARVAQLAHFARVVLPSGWIAAAEPDGDGVDFRTHSGAGYTQLEEVLAALRGVTSPSLCLHPSAGHVLSDIPSCLMFLRGRSGADVQLLLDPMAMMTAEMAPRADEHVERVLESLADHPAVAGVVVANGEVVNEEGRDRLRAVGVHRAEGVILDSRALLGMVSKHARPGLDWVILDEAVEEQQELIRMYGPGV